MSQITYPKLPCAKLGIVNNTSGTYYYVQTYTHHYDPVKKRSVRDSQKTIGKVLGGEKYGIIEFKEFFLKEHKELKDFIVYWTADGFEFKLANEEEYSLITEKPLEKKLAGGSWALQKLMSDTLIGDALRDTFGSYKRHLKLASIVIYMVLSQSNVMHNYEPFANTHWLPWFRPLNDGQISRLFQSVTADEVMNFFANLNRNYYKKFGDEFYKKVFVALDSTSISTYSECLSQKEFGHNKDGDDIPQINYLMVCDESTGLPIYGKTYKGNVVDVSTVKNLLSELKIMYSKISKVDDYSPQLVFVTDRGYDSEDNLQNFLRNGYGFVMRSMLRSKWVKSTIDDNYNDLMDDNALNTFIGQHVHSTKVIYKYDEFPVEGKNKSNKTAQPIFVHMFYDEHIREQRRAVIKDNTANARNTYNNLVDELYKNNEKVTTEMLTSIKLQKGQNYIDDYCVLDSEGYAKLSSDKINKRIRYEGIMVLLSDCESDPLNAYSAYQNRRTVETNFQVFKDYLNFNRVYTSSDRAFQGKFLCQFISASLMMLINHRIKEYEKTKEADNDKIKLSDKSMSRLLAELDTIMLTVYKGGYFFDEVSGKYKTFYKALGVPTPEAKHRYTAEDTDVDDDSYGNSQNSDYSSLPEEYIQSDEII